jgi:hypothetical protein
MRGKVVALLACLLAGAGCGEERERVQSVTKDQIPPKVLEAAKKKLPGVQFNAAWKETEGGTTAYEIRGMQKDGKIRDVKVSEAGEVLEVD